MSPPCLATIFEGDNGGATAPGVSSTEIRVAIPVDVGFTTTTGSQYQSFRDSVTAAFAYFNQAFELYGRRLVPVIVEGTASDAAGARAQGADIAAQGVFAAVPAWLEVWRQAQVGLVQELVRNKIVTVTRNGGGGWSDRALFDPLHPYAWSISPSLEQNLANLADLACSSLAHKPAAHASDTGMRNKARRFAVVVASRQATPAVTSLTDALDTCTGEAPLTSTWAALNDPSGTSLRTGLSRLQAGGATTVICVCEFRYAYDTIVPAAYGLGFNPEWLIGPTGTYSDEYFAGGTFLTHQVSAMRLDAGPRPLPVQARPWYQALISVQPELFGAATLYTAFQVAPTLYEAMMVLASGIQAAGPVLTADTFGAGLMATQFPNPGAGQPPYWQPSAGFGPGDHSFYDDYGVAWWSDTAPTVDAFLPKPFGSWCYAGLGTRFEVGRYPADLEAQLFNPDVPCR